jgi:alpha-galactosidase
MAGQSNMEGMAWIDHIKNHLLTNELFHDYYAPFVNKSSGLFNQRDDVSIRIVHELFNKTGILGSGYGRKSYPRYFGPEIGFGKTVGDYFDDQVLLIKVAYGGSTLAIDWKTPSAPPTTFNYTFCNATGCQPYPKSSYGALYRRMLSVVRETLSNLGAYVKGYDGEYQLCGFVWWQGFNDVLDEKKTSEYERNLRALLTDVRKDLGVPELPLVVAELGMLGLTPREKSHSVFREAQQAACASQTRCQYVRTAQYAVINEVRYDGEHHYFGRAEVMIRASQDFATAIIGEMFPPSSTSSTAVAPSMRAPSVSSAPGMQPSTTGVPSDSIAPALRSSVPNVPPSAITSAPSVTPLPKSFCFSGESTLQVKSNDKGTGTTLMKDIKIGDEVLTTTGKYERIYSFGHRHEFIEAEFLQLIPSELEISGDHMLMVDSHFTPASSIQVGDELESANGEIIKVEAVHRVVRRGVYAPFTASGTIVVNNIKASNYIAFQESERLMIGGWRTPLTFQWIAHISQSPHRLSLLLGMSEPEEYNVDGMSTWIVGPYEVSKWILEQNGVIVTVLLAPAVALGAVLSTIEQLMSWLA